MGEVSALIAVAIMAWFGGMCSMAAVHSFRASRATPIPNELMPRQLLERIPVESDTAEHIVSEYAPKLRGVEPPQKVLTPRQRLDKLKHWPTAIAEKEKPPAIVKIEATPRNAAVEPAQAIKARSLLPHNEFRQRS
jgi:hypothetical protein